MKKLLFVTYLLLCNMSVIHAAVYSGSCGNNVMYSLNTSTGVLSITGTGQMTDYSYGSYAPWFSNRSYVKFLTIGNGVTSIGQLAFYACSGLTSVTIPNSVTYIGVHAFESCSGLTSVTIPNSVTSIDSYAFLGCSGLTSVTIPNSVTSIESYVFNGCSGLTSVIIPNSVTSIGECAFSRCSGLTSVTIPNSVTSIGGEAFKGCKGLTSVIIPNSVTSIGDETFKDCLGLTSVTIPNSVTSIGDEAFYDCSGLTSVTIPNSVTSIGKDAFYGCLGLTSVNISDIEAWCKISFGGLYANPLYYAHELVLNGEEMRDLVIPNSLTSIGSYAFSRCSGLTSVTIPNSVTSIGSYAFNGLKIKELTIGDNVTIISYGAFEGCTELTSVVIPKSVTTIREWAFSDCSGLTTVIFNAEKCTTCGSFSRLAFPSFSELIIGKDVKKIPPYAFYSSNIQTVRSYAITPPDISSSSFQYHKDLYVRKNSLRSYSNEDYWDEFNIKTFDVLVTEITLNETSVAIEYGETLTLNATCTPSDADDTTVTWTSSNNNIATVSSTGVVTAIASGNAIITATTSNGKTATCYVTVTNSITNIILNKSTLELEKGNTSLLEVIYTPTDAENLSVKWTSNNTAVATVSNSGLVTAIAVGTATITATSTNGKTATCEVTVENQTINLVDGAISFVNEEEVDCKKLTYTRTISIAQADKYQALYIPMTVDVTSLDERINVYKIMAMFFFDLDGDGEMDESFLRITPLNGGVLMPNHAYIFKAKEADTYTFNSCDNILYPAEINELTCSTTEIDFTFKGNYVKHNPGITFYGMSGGSIKNAEGNVGAFRWYAVMSDKAGQVIEAANAKIAILENDMTDAEQVLSTEEKQVEGIFSINGAKLSAPQKGMNIIKFTDGTTIKQFINN